MSPTWLLVALAGAMLLAVALIALGYRVRWRAAEARSRRLEADRNALHAMLDTAPVGVFALAGPREGASPGLTQLLGLTAGHADFNTVCAQFETADGQRLYDSVRALQDEGASFVLTLSLAAAPRTLEVRGVVQDSGPAVWFAEVSRLADAHARAVAERDLLSLVVDGLPIPVWRRDGDLRLVDCNAAYARAVDRPRERVLAEGAELLGDSLREVGRALAERARGGGAPISESHHVVAEGKRRLMEVFEIPLGDGTAAGGGLLGLALDRTQAEELQSELSRHVSAHAEVLETLSTAIVIFGPDLRVKFYNGGYVQLWGLEESFLDGEPHLNEVMERLRELRQLPEQRDFPAFKRDMVNQLRSLVKTEEDLLHRPDGTTLRMTLSPHPFGGVLATYEDVTDRLALERGFNTLVDVQRETIENLYEAVAVFGSDGRLALCNQVYFELWSLSPEQLGERPHVRKVAEAVRDHFDVSDTQWPALLERMVARATEPEPGHGRVERSDGMVLDWTQVPLPDGQSLFTYLDVTDSIRVERALREQAAALETADRLKSEFIANISYELRTPLNAIIGFAEILENEYFGQLNARQGEYATAIVHSTQRLIGLINDILDLATIEAGYLELETSEVDVCDLLNDLQRIAYERAHNRGIELKVDCPEDVGTLTGDARRLKQALFNLISNAFNFTPDGGTITLTAEQVSEDRSEMRLSVVDTGVGIPEEEQANVFNKFVRGKVRKTGAGLGLSLVKSLVELHGGSVELVSSLDAGTRVTCHLPLDAALPVDGVQADAG